MGIWGRSSLAWIKCNQGQYREAEMRPSAHGSERSPFARKTWPLIIPTRRECRSRLRSSSASRGVPQTQMN
jgi:hypothetical protein